MEKGTYKGEGGRKGEKKGSGRERIGEREGRREEGERLESWRQKKSVLGKRTKSHC